MPSRYRLDQPWTPARRWGVRVGESFALPDGLSDETIAQVAEAVKRGILTAAAAGRPADDEKKIPAGKAKPRPKPKKKRPTKKRAATKKPAAKGD